MTSGRRKRCSRNAMRTSWRVRPWRPCPVSRSTTPRTSIPRGLSSATTRIRSGSSHSRIWRRRSRDIPSTSISRRSSNRVIVASIPVRAATSGCTAWPTVMVRITNTSPQPMSGTRRIDWRNSRRSIGISVWIFVSNIPSSSVDSRPCSSIRSPIIRRILMSIPSTRSLAGCSATWGCTMSRPCIRARLRQ